MTNKQKLIEDLTPLLKERGYRKQKQTWYRQGTDLVIVFNIQNSAYDEEGFYINLGIIIKKLMGEHDGICLTNCQIRQRISGQNERRTLLTAEKLMKVLDLWEQWYGNLPGLRQKALEGKLPIESESRAVSFLTTVRLG